LAFKIVYKASVSRDLARLPKAEARRILNRLERDLAGNADACPVLKGKFAGLRKYRVGDHRVIFALVESQILILRIGHRRDVYR
jgi:mRNA-degrading endonuclease RelE of RelBE toxin-antitoxin system